jgi:exopolysaccharide production protein ExoQ
MLIAVVCVIVGFQSGVTGLDGTDALQGVYDSKNAFSAVICVLLLIALSVIADRGQSMIFRFCALAAILACPILLYMGHSVGAMAAVFLAVIIYKFTRVVSGYTRPMRVLTYMAAVVLVATVAVTMALTQSDSLAFLNLLGKDSTLTGRTYLWTKAIHYIGERPLGGVGYRAFWRIGNPRAEELWFAAHVKSGAGFNFHNEYLEMGVELGLMGMFLTIGYFLIVGKRATAAVFGKLRVEQTFACLMFILMMLRSPVEVGIFDQFSLTIILFCTSWIYLRPEKADKENPIPYPNIKRNSLGNYVSPVMPDTKT